MAEQKWLPLESNPVVMNKYAQALGVGVDYQFVDIYGLDAELLMMVPKPVLAVLLLFPIKEDAAQIGEAKENAGLFYMKQTIGNACGTIALIHALANNRDKLDLKADKPLAQFLEKTKDKTAEERAEILGLDEAFRAVHEESALEGQTAAPSRDVEMIPHFVAFVHAEGGLYELDGRQGSPKFHGDTTPDTLLEDAAKTVKKFMARDPDEVNFTLVALAKNE